MTDAELLALAREARKNAYAPYSGFSVGAALLAKNGKTYLGCNIENASFSPTVCAERVAFLKAVSEGEKDFLAIAIVGGRGETTSPDVTPCGVCRQVMGEFCKGVFRILTEDRDGNPIVRILSGLLPSPFGGRDA